MALNTALRDINTYLCAGTITVLPSSDNAVRVTSQATWWKKHIVTRSLDTYTESFEVFLVQISLPNF